MTANRDIKIIEAILFASNEPVEENILIEKISDKKKLNTYLSEIKEYFSSRGINLIKVGKKWSFRTSAEIRDSLIIFKKQKRRLSRAAQETLAIIAYMQPITRSEIENIRGVQMGRGSIDHLLEIGWIKPNGRRIIPGKPTLWSTTNVFLEHFEIEDITSLPNKEELKASGFMEKKSALATITDLALDTELLTDENEQNNGETLDDFLTSN